MGHDHADDSPNVFTFESVGIGRSGEGPADFVPLDTDPTGDSDERGHRARRITLGVGVVALLAVIGWATLGRSSPKVPDGVRPGLPTDPTKTFTWTADNVVDGTVFVGGSAGAVIVLADTADGGVAVVLNADGSERWRVDAAHFEYATATLEGEDVIMLANDQWPGEPGGTVTITSLNVETGEENWQTSVAGDWSFAYDRRVVVFDERQSDATSEGGLFPGENPGDLVSIDLTTGQNSEPVSVDSFHGGTGVPLVITRDGEATIVDGDLRPTSSPIPVDVRFLGVADDHILTTTGSEMVLYDPDGTVIESRPLPDYLSTAAYHRLLGAGDVWFYTDEETMTSGGFRYGADGEPTELWRQETSFAWYPLTFAVRDSATAATEPYAIRRTVGEEISVGAVELIDPATGDPVLQADSITPGLDGVVTERDGRLLGYAAPTFDAARPTFVVPLSDHSDQSGWSLLDGAVAVIDTELGDGSVSVTIYS